ncbi:MAG: hypothetical protein ABI024_02405, partial [Vicinamibacterales bacterium]
SREGQGRSNTHAAIGTIEYSVVDGAGAPNGTILYLKATLSGDESVDVRHFAQADPLFPHESTANQFFDEARFESYRALGFHTVPLRRVAHRALTAPRPCSNVSQPSWRSRESPRHRGPHDSLRGCRTRPAACSFPR